MGDSLPIIEVTDDNFLTVLPALQAAIKSASFLAIDCELTGIGERKKINEPAIDLRYQYTAEVARSHAVIALGLSCFTCKSVSSIQGNHGGHLRSHDYLVQTFNVLTLCSGSFTVECKAHKFLLDHGFDFNKLYAKGLQYYKGCDQQPNEAPNVRHLFSAIVKYRKPVVIHNGLMDLTFLYQSFYADLPRKLETFAADLTDMFPAGIYDTKYIAEFHQTLPATYLEYLYKKMQLKNARLGGDGEWHVRVNFPPYPRTLPSIEWHPYCQILSYNTEADCDEAEVCLLYALHGWCGKGKLCEKSHNINKIVKTLQPQGAKKRGKSKYTGPTNGASLARIIQHQAGKREPDEELYCNSDENSRDSMKFTNRRNADENSQDCMKSKNRSNSESSQDSVKSKNGRRRRTRRRGKGKEKQDFANSVPGGIKRDSHTATEDEVENKKTRMNGESQCNDKMEVEEELTENEKIVESNPPPPPETKPKNTHIEKIVESNPPPPSEKKPRTTHNSSGHRAGFDAFMTGYIFACHISKSNTLSSESDPFTPENIGLSELANKVYLMGKSFPFLIRTGTYANMSTNHTTKIPKLRDIT